MDVAWYEVGGWVRVCYCYPIREGSRAQTVKLSYISFWVDAVRNHSLSLFFRFGVGRIAPGLLELLVDWNVGTGLKLPGSWETTYKLLG